MTLKWRKVGVARPDLGNLINAAFHAGEITILQIGKRDKAAIVPLDMVPEYQEVMARTPSFADPFYSETEVAVEPRTAPSQDEPELPLEVGAHSHAAKLASAFEQLPDTPSDDELSDIDYEDLTVPDDWEPEGGR